MAPLSPARIILSLLPAVVLVVTGASALFGDGGLLVHAQLRERRNVLNAEIIELSNLNACLLREISVLEHDPLARRRAAADTLGRAEPGAVLYSFSDPPSAAGASARPSQAPGSVGPDCALIARSPRHTGVLDSPR